MSVKTIPNMSGQLPKRYTKNISQTIELKSNMTYEVLEGLRRDSVYDF